MKRLWGRDGGGGAHDGGERGRRSPCLWSDRRRRRRPVCPSAGAGDDSWPDRRRPRDDEARLYERLIQRDEAALLECLDRFGHIVYSTSLSETGESVAAEAVTERVFVELWCRPEGFHPTYGPLVLQLIRAALRPSAV